MLSFLKASYERKVVRPKYDCPWAHVQNHENWLTSNISFILPVSQYSSWVFLTWSDYGFPTKTVWELLLHAAAGYIYSPTTWETSYFGPLYPISHISSRKTLIGKDQPSQRDWAFKLSTFQLTQQRNNSHTVECSCEALVKNRRGWYAWCSILPREGPVNHI